MGSTAVTLDRIAEVLRGAGLQVELRGEGDLAVSGATQDSRSVAPGDLFLAWTGTAHDAHSFVEDAAGSGAVAALVERFVESDLPQLRVDDARRAGAIAAHLLHGAPGDRLFLAGVTGTNGKTTTAFLSRELLSRRGPAAALGTLGVVGTDGEVRPGTGGLTTPGPVEICRRLAELAAEGAECVALEASSHALEQRRLDGLSFDVAAFTNLTRDHLDYHADFPSYLAAKARLLELVRADGGVVVNGEAKAWSGLPPLHGRLLVTRVLDEDLARRGDAGAGPEADERLPDLEARGVELGGEGTRIRLAWDGNEVEARTRLLGRFNVENAIVAVGVGLLAGLSLEEAAAALADASAPPGRLEIVAREPATVLIDFAHTPDALVRVLETLRPLYAGRLIAVFGAGGDRDRTKRPEMGEAVARMADVAIVTSDNPRTEDPERIVDDVIAGMEGATYERIVDRREAIRRALEIAGPGDAVLLAGKGHEMYQEVGTERGPFDERRIVREILAAGRPA